MKECENPSCDSPTGPERCRLNQLGVGCGARVVAVEGEAGLRRRLLEMGFCGGATVECIRRAPLGDPIEFRVRGYHLSLRGDQAKHVTVEPLGDGAVADSRAT